MASIEGDTSVGYSRQVGERLRAIRKQRRLSLQDVEAQSEKEFKASVLGAYERGERALSVPRLDRLAMFYSVPVEQFLPHDITGRAPSAAATRSTSPTDGKLTIDVAALLHMSGAPFDMLARYLRLIQLQRHDLTGQVIAIRGDDAPAIATILEVPIDQVADRVAALGLAVTPDD